MVSRWISNFQDWMKEVRWSRTSEGTGLSLAIVIASVSLSMVAIYSPWPWRESPWTALAAVATFMATWSALHISKKEVRIRLDEQRKAAAVMAAQGVVALGRSGERLYALVLASAISRYGPNALDDPKVFTDRESYKLQQAALGDLTTSIPDEQLVKMLVIPEEFAIRVAAVKANARILLDELERLNEWFNMMPHRSDIDRRRMREYWTTLEDTCQEVKDLAAVGERFLQPNDRAQSSF